MRLVEKLGDAYDAGAIDAESFLPDPEGADRRDGRGGAASGASAAIGQ
jgi:hypothetical protein